MEVSIVIPVYNRETIVERTLASVAAQTYRPLQVVLVDNMSTDGTLQVLQRFQQTYHASDFKVEVMQEPHRTAGAARNTGFTAATGRWVLFFDSDDEMAPRLVERYVRTIERQSGEPDLVSTRSTLVWADGSRQNTSLAKTDLFGHQILNSQFATQRYAVRREFFAATDGWNINLPRWNDYELGLRLLLARPRVAFMGGSPMVTVNHSGEQSITGNGFAPKAGDWEMVLDIMHTEVVSSALKPRHRQRLKRLLDYRRMVLAAQYQREGCPQLARPLCQKAVSRLRESYGDSLRWRWFMQPLLKWMFGRIVAGKRGASQIARIVF
ncbi:MAG: glycosyltransferase family 2 protein [Muribaculaceae bacterium]|nr:glycosyltransferase family 2 protein [Muribaculaceae bacterium]